MKDKIIKIQKDESLSEKFFEVFEKELMSDEEPPDRKFRQLAGQYFSNPEIIDNVLINICGWSMESLVKMTLSKN